MRVAFRTEGNHRQGMGDLLGSAALADECQRQSGEVLFVISGGSEAVAVLREGGYPFRVAESSEAEREILEAYQPDIIVLNKLDNPPAYVRWLRALAPLVVTIDDAGEGAAHADVSINVLYHRPGALTDSRYIVLRREFQAIHAREKVVAPEVRELLITQGGSDTYGFAPRILRALESITLRLHCVVVVGPAFRHHAELEAAVSASTLDLSVVRNVRNMAELMWRADLAITAGGLSVFELCCVGTPSLVVCGEPFEVETAARVDAAGAVVNLGFGGDLDYAALRGAVEALAASADKRRQMSARGKELVDGRGCERIVRLLRERLARVEAG